MQYSNQRAFSPESVPHPYLSRGCTLVLVPFPLFDSFTRQEARFETCQFLIDAPDFFQQLNNGLGSRPKTCTRVARQGRQLRETVKYLLRVAMQSERCVLCYADCVPKFAKVDGVILALRNSLNPICQRRWLQQLLCTFARLLLTDLARYNDKS